MSEFMQTLGCVLCRRPHVPPPKSLGNGVVGAILGGAFGEIQRSVARVGFSAGVLLTVAETPGPILIVP